MRQKFKKKKPHEILI